MPLNRNRKKWGRLVRTCPGFRERTKFGSFDYSLQRDENHTKRPLVLLNNLLLSCPEGAGYRAVAESGVELANNGVGLGNSIINSSDVPMEGS